LIWRLHTTQDTLARLEELKIEYVPKEENSPNVPEIRTIEKNLGELEKEGLHQQVSSKKCKVLDGKDQKRAEVH
jgi:hypothetical protein